MAKFPIDIAPEQVVKEITVRVRDKTGIFVIYFEVVRSIRGFEIGWVLVGSWIWVLAKVKIQDLPQKLVCEPVFFKI